MQTNIPGYRFQTKPITRPNPNDYTKRSAIGIFNDAGEEVSWSEYFQAYRQHRAAQSRARSATPQPSRGGGVRSRANNLTTSLIGGA